MTMPPALHDALALASDPATWLGLARVLYRSLTDHGEAETFDALDLHELVQWGAADAIDPVTALERLARRGLRLEGDRDNRAVVLGLLALLGECEEARAGLRGAWEQVVREEN